MFAQYISRRFLGLRNFGEIFIFWGRFGLFRIFDWKMPEICVFRFSRFGKNVKISSEIQRNSEPRRSNPGVNLGNIRSANSVLHHGYYSSIYKIKRDKERIIYLPMIIWKKICERMNWKTPFYYGRHVIVYNY